MCYQTLYYLGCTFVPRSTSSLHHPTATVPVPQNDGSILIPWTIFFSLFSSPTLVNTKQVSSMSKHESTKDPWISLLLLEPGYHFFFAGCP